MMKTIAATSDVSLCTSCYTDLGWVLTANAKCLLCPATIPGCIACTADNATSLLC